MVFTVIIRLSYIHPVFLSKNDLPCPSGVSPGPIGQSKLKAAETQKDKLVIRQESEGSYDESL